MMSLLRFCSVIRFFTGSLFAWIFLGLGASIAGFLCAPLRAQGFYGCIMAGDTAGIPYATVYIPALKKGAITDSKGYYRVESIPAGAYRVEFSSIGYQTMSDTLVLTTGEELEYPVRLQETAYMLKEVFVMPDGGNYALEVMRKVGENASSYYDAIASYEAEVADSYEQNIADFPVAFRRMIKTMAFLTPARKYVNLIFKYPELTFKIAQTVSYDGKDAVNRHCRLVECNEKLSDKERKLIVPKEESPSFLFRAVSNRYLPWGEREIGKYGFEWRGSYEEGGHIVDVIEFTPKKDSYAQKGCVHVIKDLWCVLKVEYASLAGDGRIECREILPDLFLPVSILDAVRFEIPADSIEGIKGMNFCMSTGRSITYTGISVKE